MAVTYYVALPFLRTDDGTAPLPANRTATHPRHAARRALTPHGAPYRRSD